jgi:hypothetical protein
MPQSAPKRDRKTKSVFPIQPHDIEFLKTIAQHRFLRSTHLDRLFSRISPRGIRRRMRLLVQHGYAYLVSVKRNDKQWGGRIPLVYGIKGKAKKLLKNAELHSPTRLAWLTRPARQNPSIEHQLMISDFLVSLAVEATASEDYEFIPPWRFGKEISSHDRMNLRVTINLEDKRISLQIIPDAVCAIRFNRYGKKVTRVVLYEAYRNRNVVLTSRNLKRKSIVKTLYGYQELQRQRKTHQFFPHPFTVVVSSNVNQRIESIRSLISNQGLFRFLDSPEFETQSDLILKILNRPQISPQQIDC